MAINYPLQRAFLILLSFVLEPQTLKAFQAQISFFLVENERTESSYAEHRKSKYLVTTQATRLINTQRFEERVDGGFEGSEGSAAAEAALETPVFPPFAAEKVTTKHS